MSGRTSIRVPSTAPQPDPKGRGLPPESVSLCIVAFWRPPSAGEPAVAPQYRVPGGSGASRQGNGERTPPSRALHHDALGCVRASLRAGTPRPASLAPPPAETAGRWCVDRTTSTPHPSTAYVGPPPSRAPACAAASMPSASPLTTGTPLDAANSASSRVSRRPWSLGCRDPTIEIRVWARVKRQARTPDKERHRGLGQLRKHSGISRLAEPVAADPPLGQLGAVRGHTPSIARTLASSEDELLWYAHTAEPGCRSAGQRLAAAGPARQPRRLHSGGRRSDRDPHADVAGHTDPR